MKTGALKPAKGLRSIVDEADRWLQLVGSACCVARGLASRRDIVKRYEVPPEA